MGIKGNLPRKRAKENKWVNKEIIHDEGYNKVEGLFPSIDVH